MIEFRKNTPSLKKREVLTKSNEQEFARDPYSNKVFDSNIESSHLERQGSQKIDNSKAIICENSFSKYSNAKVVGNTNLTIPGNLPEEYKSYHDALGKQIIDEVGTLKILSTRSN